MKKILFLNALLWATSILPASGQTIWNQLPLTGASAKIIPTAKQPRFNISLTSAFPLGGVADQNIPLTSLQNAAFSPGTAEQLFEQLGGQFFIGNPPGQHSQAIELAGKTKFMPGLRLGLRLGNRLELRAGGQYFQSKWSGEFPVTVLPFDQQSKFKTLQGNVNASSSGVLAETDLAFFLANGTVRPYLKAGARGIFPTKDKSGANIAGVALPVEIEPTATEFSPFGGAGLRVGFFKSGFVEAGVSYGKVLGGGFVPSIEIGVGWSFGQVLAQAGGADDDGLPCGAERSKQYKDIWAKDAADAESQAETRIKAAYDCKAPCEETTEIKVAAKLMNEKDKGKKFGDGVVRYLYKVTVKFKCVERK